MDASTQLQLKQCFRFQEFSTQKRSSNFECKHPLATANGSVLSATIDGRDSFTLGFHTAMAQDWVISIISGASAKESKICRREPGQVREYGGHISRRQPIPRRKRSRVLVHGSCGYPA